MRARTLAECGDAVRAPGCAPRRVVPRSRAAPGAASRRPSCAAPRAGVALVVVAVALPDPRLVVVEQLERADPLRRLPEVAPGDQQPGRAAVVGLERRSVVGVGDQDVVVEQRRERQVRRVAAVGVDEHVRVAPGRGRARSTRSRTRTPRHVVSNFDQRVTQWRSVVSSVCGSARSSPERSAKGASASPCTDSDQVSVAARGVGPIERTGTSGRRLTGRQALRIDAELGGAALAAVREELGGEGRHATRTVAFARRALRLRRGPDPVALGDESDDVAHDPRDLEVLRRVDRGDAGGLAAAATSASGMIPPTTTGTSTPRVAQRVDDAGISSRCEPERIDRPTTWTPSWTRRRGDLRRRQADALVDDVHARVACANGDLLGAVGVAVEAGLADEDLRAGGRAPR